MKTTTYLGEFQIREGTNDLGIIEETLTNELYDFKRFKTENIKKIVDVGSHIGAFIHRAVKECPEACIYGYEPVEENFKLLQENTKQFSKERCVLVFQRAVYGNYSCMPVGKGNEDYRAEDGLINTGATDFVYGPGNPIVDCISIEVIQDMWKEIDVLKLDCEGGEQSIIPYLKLDRVGIIMAEFHVEIFKPVYSPEVRDMLIQRILDAGFKIYYEKGLRSNMPLVVFVNEEYCKKRGIL